MKKQLTFGMLALAFTAQSQFLQVSGRHLLDANGNAFTLRGINYPIIDDYNVHTDNAAEVEARLDELALTGANCVRFPWYTNGVHYKDQLDAGTNPGYGPGSLESYVADGHLGHMLGYAHAKGMIPILEIHDLTGGNDNATFNSQVMGFWTDPDVLAMITAHQEYLIINLANEYGMVNFAGNPAAASVTFRDHYISAISTLRGLGVKVPVMIDAPDYGQSSTELLAIAPAILQGDPAHNVIFSAHAYWAVYANTAPAVATKLDEIENTNVCFILGEVANSQADAPTYCGELDLSTLYPVILTGACSRNIGWLAWSFDEDCDPDREISHTATFASLTPYGNDIVYNAGYGLLSENGCGAQQLDELGVPAFSQVALALVPNPGKSVVQLQTDAAGLLELTVTDMQGKTIGAQTVAADATIDCSAWTNGVYFFHLQTAAGKGVSRFVKAD